jgi:CRP-like cAMP-binding protein
MYRDASCSCCSNNSCILANQRHVMPVGVKQLRFNKKSIVYSAGLPGESVFMVCSGSVSLALGDTHGRERIVRFVPAGGLFGLDSLLPSKTRLFTAIARAESLVCVMSNSTFERVVKQDGERLWSVFLQVVEELFDSQIEKLEISGDRVARRLRNTLARIPGYSATTAGLEIKQWELAQFLGVSEETVSRQLKTLRGRQGATSLK